MVKEITSKVIGILRQDQSLPDWWKSAEIEIPFFDNRRLIITFTDYEPELDPTFMEEADQALVNFMKLTVEDRKSISELAYKRCMAFLEAVEFDKADDYLRQIKNKDEIWNFIQPTEIYVVNELHKGKGVDVEVACQCDWEQEHGLQLLFKQGKKLSKIH
ncbi:hypothetical protein SGQ83_07630 [Flavobacterium sp. Fl-318]|uniref:DUF6985 domain-containing protein n=1 Tax=Flavobacterium cupriresistens TaxID=2893885 RepID=A0ABU4R9G2_9FLAO|nr:MULTISPECIES: hypothetical protein [unclassified Flavobacterium]MDX6189212.1 hypothetical protein [Flavobacterium sp. Fl-318]UFH41308.1 hypothetical protein LNP23_16000 [Flavobacterium sp. F-323]